MKTQNIQIFHILRFQRPLWDGSFFQQKIENFPIWREILKYVGMELCIRLTITSLPNLKSEKSTLTPGRGRGLENPRKSRQLSLILIKFYCLNRTYGEGGLRIPIFAGCPLWMTPKWFGKNMYFSLKITNPHSKRAKKEMVWGGWKISWLPKRSLQAI